MLDLALRQLNLWLDQERDRQRAMEYCLDYRARGSRDGPLLNFGCGDTQFGDLNVDVVPRSVERFKLIPAEPPYRFRNGEFGLALASHVIEHVPDPDAVRDELCRIAKNVILLVPNVEFFCAYLPSHRWFFPEGPWGPAEANPLFGAGGMRATDRIPDFIMKLARGANA